MSQNTPTVKYATVRAVARVAVCVLLAAVSAQADDLKVVSSGGFAAAYSALTPAFERATTHKVTTEWGPSMGKTAGAIPNRLQRGEIIDVVIMASEALDALIAEGKVLAGSRVDLARSKIGMAVRAGVPKPDISSVEALKKVLLEAKSVAYSDSASGVYLSTILFQRLGIAERVLAKSTMVPADPVGGVVARGDAEIGFQQMSELLPIPGIIVVGPLPADAQQVTVFAAGIPSGAAHAQAARELIAFLASPAAAPAIEKSGMEPVVTRR